jgi:hypothetical protein
LTFDPEKLRSIGHLKGGRTMSRTASGREHPDSGLPYQVTRDELGNDVTEHGKAGSGLSERQDVNINAETVTADLGMREGG